jgi:hypothetical protein
VCEREHLTRIRPNFWAFQEKYPILGLIRLEFGDWEDKIAAMSQSVVKMPSVGEPKLLDQRVKASLTRQE